jgi:hypothetical protein
MLLSRYQITEIIVGTSLFPILYFIYLFLTNSYIIMTDIIWCSLTVALILLFKNFYINFNLLQTQNQNFHLTL